jgi:hypothetical protein
MTTEPMTDATGTTPAPAKVTRARARTSKPAEPVAGARVTDQPAADPPIDARPASIVLSQGGMDTAEADTISVTQGGISVATADAIDIRQGGIGRANATDIAVSAGGIGLANGERVTLEMGGILGAVGREVRLVQSISRLVGGRTATVDQSVVGTLVAGEVTLRQPSGILVLLAGRVHGDVRPVVDWRGALAFGAAVGLVLGLLRIGRR